MKKYEVKCASCGSDAWKERFSDIYVATWMFCLVVKIGDISVCFVYCVLVWVARCMKTLWDFPPGKEWNNYHAIPEQQSWNQASLGSPGKEKDFIVADDEKPGSIENKFEKK